VAHDAAPPTIGQATRAAATGQSDTHRRDASATLNDDLPGVVSTIVRTPAALPSPNRARRAAAERALRLERDLLQCDCAVLELRGPDAPRWQQI